MNQNIVWNLSPEKCFEIIHLTLIDILEGNRDKTLTLDALIKTLNTRTKVYKLHNEKKYNSFSKYLKEEYDGLLNFIECYNFYDIIYNDKEISIKLYKNLVDLNDIKYSGKRITRDNEWVFIDD
jgi:hypothetical protein|tara:strand:+ start:1468 stop:1839 length:372 start_codon:yes stop_codon:yes gene_type:complete